MSNIANRLYDDGTFDVVFAKDCTEADRFGSYVCPNCGRPMFLCMGDVIEKHFSGNHVDGCCIASDRYKTSTTSTGYVLSIQALINHVDKPVSREIDVHGGDIKGPDPQPKNKEDMFTVFVPGKRCLNNINSIYRLASSLSLDDVIDIDTGLTCKIFLSMTIPFTTAAAMALMKKCVL